MSRKSIQLKNFNTTDPELIHNQIVPLIPQINKTSTSEDIPNVLLLAIDSISYLNFKRQFPKTKSLLKEHHFYELRGYTKVGTNTFPNMIPFLTGQHYTELTTDQKLKYIYFDDWPIIWRNYSSKGFVTAFLEEMSTFGLFHFNLKGFRGQTTDYMLRPFHRKIKEQKYDDYCYLDKTETEVSPAHQIQKNNQEHLKIT